MAHKQCVPSGQITPEKLLLSNSKIMQIRVSKNVQVRHVNYPVPFNLYIVEESGRCKKRSPWRDISEKGTVFFFNEESQGAQMAKVTEILAVLKL
jgi:hypothetical protein